MLLLRSASRIIPKWCNTYGGRTRSPPIVAIVTTNIPTCIDHKNSDIISKKFKIPNHGPKAKKDMVGAMKKAVGMKSTDTVMSSEERNLLSVAYKNVVGARRSAWRIVSNLEQKAKEGKDKVSDPSHVQICEDYKSKIEAELMATCKEVIDLVENSILPNIKLDDPEGVEAMVFFKKMLGDYCRYTVEVKTGDDRKENADKSGKYYQEAYDLATEKMPSTNPIRLGLALNYSVFYYEIVGAPDKACSLAKEAFDNAIASLDSLNEESYKDSTLIMQLLRDNLTLWTSEAEGSQQDQDDD